MARLMVVYNTVDGSIIRTAYRRIDTSSLSSGTGFLTALHLTGVDLDGNEPGDVARVMMTKNGITMLRRVDHWIDDTHVVLKSAAKLLEGDVSWELVAEVAAAQFGAQEKADAIAEVKAQEGHTNVDGILITTDLIINPSEWFVDTADGNKLKSITTQTFTPE